METFPCLINGPMPGVRVRSQFQMRKMTNWHFVAGPKREKKVKIAGCEGIRLNKNWILTFYDVLRTKSRVWCVVWQTVSVPIRSKSVLFRAFTWTATLAATSVKHRFYPQFDSCCNFALVSERINWENTQNSGEYARSDCAVDTLKRVNYFRNCKMQRESSKKRLIRRSICFDCTHPHCYELVC